MMLLNVDDYRLRSRELLTEPIVAYLEGGAGDEQTLAENRAAYQRWHLRQRVLRTSAVRDLSTELFGTRVSLPVLLSPTGTHKSVHPDGEVAVARAAAAADTIMIVSTAASTPLEEIAAASPEGRRWFQLGLFRDRGISRDLVQRAEAAGYRAILPMVDTPFLAKREREVRTGLYPVLAQYPWANLAPYTGSQGAADEMPQFLAEVWDKTYRWHDLEELRKWTKLPLIIKGIMEPEDARIAVELGFDGILISNHGGRGIDSAPGTLDVLPEILEAVAGRCPVLLDGGVRRGTDVLKALALGADAVCLGRPYLWGLAVNGESGVRSVIEILRAELDEAMALCGVATVAELNGGVIRPAMGYQR